MAKFRSKWQKWKWNPYNWNQSGNEQNNQIQNDKEWFWKYKNKNNDNDVNNNGNDRNEGIKWRSYRDYQSDNTKPSLLDDIVKKNEK